MIISRHRFRLKDGRKASITIGRGIESDEAENIKFWQEELTAEERFAAVTECVYEFYALRNRTIPAFRRVLRTGLIRRPASRKIPSSTNRRPAK